MDMKLFFTFCGIALVLELLAILPVVYKANKYRSGNDSAFDEAVVASLAKTGTLRDGDRWVNWGRYEWEYRGKKHHHTFYDSSRILSPLQKHASYWNPPAGGYPGTAESLVSRKTGEPKPPEGERRVFRMKVWVTLGAIAAAYILAKIICG